MLLLGQYSTRVGRRCLAVRGTAGSTVDGRPLAKLRIENPRLAAGRLSRRSDPEPGTSPSRLAVIHVWDDARTARPE
jgi:hypothetical protein